VVQDTDLHGGTTAGPVVRDVVKAFYDKKNARMLQQATTAAPAQSAAPPAAKAITPATAAMSGVPIESPEPPQAVLAGQAESVQHQ